MSDYIDNGQDDSPVEDNTPTAEIRPNVYSETVNQYLKYEFSEGELREKAQEMARAVASKEQAEDKLKSIKTSINSDIAAADAKIRLCSEHLRSGYEFRNVECRKEINYTLGICQIIRLDTGEVVTSRAINHNESQMHLV